MIEKLCKNVDSVLWYCTSSDSTGNWTNGRDLSLLFTCVSTSITCWRRICQMKCDIRRHTQNAKWFSGVHTLQRTDSFGEVIFNKTGVKNLFTADSNCSSLSAVPSRNRTLSNNSDHKKEWKFSDTKFINLIWLFASYLQSIPKEEKKMAFRTFFAEAKSFRMKLWKAICHTIESRKISTKFNITDFSVCRWHLFLVRFHFVFYFNSHKTQYTPAFIR